MDFSKDCVCLYDHNGLMMVLMVVVVFDKFISIIGNMVVCVVFVGIFILVVLESGSLIFVVILWNCDNMVCYFWLLVVMSAEELKISETLFLHKKSMIKETRHALNILH